MSPRPLAGPSRAFALPPMPLRAVAVRRSAAARPRSRPCHRPPGSSEGAQGPRGARRGRAGRQGFELRFPRWRGRTGVAGVPPNGTTGGRRDGALASETELRPRHPRLECDQVRERILAVLPALHRRRHAGLPGSQAGPGRTWQGARALRARRRPRLFGFLDLAGRGAVFPRGPRLARDHRDSEGDRRQVGCPQQEGRCEPRGLV